MNAGSGRRAEFFSPSPAWAGEGRGEGGPALPLTPAFFPQAGRGGRTVVAALFCLFVSTSSVFAHEVHHAVETAGAVSVRLTFADGQPFAFEAFEVYAAGSDRPLAVGRTDAQGRAVFVPPESGEVRLRAFAADGHGVDLTLNPPRGGTAAAAPAAEDRPAKLMFGAGILLALFGLIQLFVRRGKSS